MDLLLGLGVLLVVVWIIAWVAFHVIGAFIHILVIVGVILLVWWAIRRFL